MYIESGGSTLLQCVRVDTNELHACHLNECKQSVSIELIRIKLRLFRFA